MTDKPAVHRLVRDMIIVFFLMILVVGFGILYFSRHRHHSVAKTGASVDCIDHSSSEIITFFYKPGTSPGRINAIVASVHGSVSESYTSLHGESISVARSNAAHVISSLKSYPEITSANGSSSQECIDTD